MPDYSIYLKRKQQELEKQASRSYTGLLRGEISDVGRETERIARETRGFMGRQNVPLSARLEATKELQTNYAGAVGTATRDFMATEQKRQAGISDQLSEVSAAIDEANAQSKRAIQDTAIHVGGFAVGAGITAITGNPAFMQYGAAAGQVASGGVNIAQGQGTAEDWANIGEGISSGAMTLMSEQKLKSVKAKQQLMVQGVGEIINSPNYTEDQKLNALKYAELQSNMGIYVDTDTILQQIQGVIPPTPTDKPLLPDLSPNSLYM
jgi:hypothetical protein